jgi:hypothetical protein
MLATEGEWCHEDLPVDLPPWLVPLARAAGLRWQGLTFSYLVLRRDGRRLFDEAALGFQRPGGRRVHLRVVSELMRTKGKAEIFACTDEGVRLRMRRLNRDAVRREPGQSAAAESDPAARATAAWDSLSRGDVVTIRATGSAPADERGRIDATAEIDVWPAGK